MGTVEWDNALQGDHVILRPDGSPTYQFANPFDDIDDGGDLRDPRRGSAVLDPAPARALPGARRPRADFRPPADGARAGQAQALEAPRGHLRGGVPRRRRHRRRARELPRARRLELRRPHELHDARRAGGAVHARAGHPQPRGVRPGEARVAERRASARAARRQVRRGAADLPRGGVLAARVPAAAGRRGGAAGTGEDAGARASSRAWRGFLFGPPERDPASWERVAKDERAPASLRGSALRARGRRSVARRRPRGRPPCRMRARRA